MHLLMYAQLCYGVTLDQCIEKALRNSILLNAYEKKVRAIYFLLKKDKSSLFPQFSISSETDYLPLTRAVSGIKEMPVWNQLISAESTLDLQKILANYPESSHLELEKNQLIAKTAEYIIEKEVSQEYFKLHVALRKRTDYLEAKSYFDAHITDIETLKNEGLDVGFDLLRAQVKRDSISLIIRTNNKEIESTLLSLNSLMASHFDESDFSATHIPAVDTQEAFLEDVQENIADHVSELYSSQKDMFDVKIAKQLYHQSKFYFVPSLNFGYDRNFVEADRINQDDRLFLAFSVPVFDFGQMRNESRRLQYEFEYQKKLFEENQRVLIVYIKQLVNQLQSAQQTYQGALLNSENSKNMVAIANSLYKKGKIKEFDLLDTFSQFISSNDLLYDALSDYLNKKTELDYTLKKAKK